MNEESSVNFKNHPLRFTQDKTERHGNALRIKTHMHSHCTYHDYLFNLFGGVAVAAFSFT